MCLLHCILNDCLRLSLSLILFQIVLASEEVKLVQKEETSHARTLLAQWWKWKQRQNSNEDEQCLPNSTSPNTLLHHVAKYI